MTFQFQMTPSVQSAIDVLSEWIAARHLLDDQPGLSTGIVVDQELVWTGSYGYADIANKVPASSNTLYRIASISKLFTATSIVQLRDASKLGLDDPITRYLPWFKIQNRFPDAPPITIRNLITHTSGLPREADFPYWSEKFEFPDLEQLKEVLPTQENALPTYTRWKYSNLAVSLAGEIVAAASGMPYTDYVKANILDPLGMTNTYAAMDAPPPGLSIGYNRKFPGKPRDPLPFIDCRAITPAANLATSVEDLAKFAMLQFRSGPAGGAQILSGWSLAEMHRPHWVNPGWDGGWGLGFIIWRKAGKTYVGHTGGLQGFTTYFVTCPEDKIAAIALTNSNDSEPSKVIDGIFNWVAPRILEAMPKPKPAQVDGLERYAGKYRTYSNLTNVMLHDGGLVLFSPLEEDPFAAAAKLIPEGEHTFRVEAANGFGLHGEKVTFELNPDGTVYRMKTGANYAYRVKDWLDF